MEPARCWQQSGSETVLVRYRYVLFEYGLVMQLQNKPLLVGGNEGVVRSRSSTAGVSSGRLGATKKDTVPTLFHASGGRPLKQEMP